jgi:hypothetical protein
MEVPEVCQPVSICCKWPGINAILWRTSCSAMFICQSTHFLCDKESRRVANADGKSECSAKVLKMPCWMCSRWTYRDGSAWINNLFLSVDAGTSWLGYRARPNGCCHQWSCNSAWHFSFSIFVLIFCLLRYKIIDFILFRYIDSYKMLT